MTSVRCVPWSCGFLSLRLKFFHQLAKSFFSLIDSVCTKCGAALGPPAPAEAVDGPLVVMPGESPGDIATPAYSMRNHCGVGGRVGGDGGGLVARLGIWGVGRQTRSPGRWSSMVWSLLESSPSLWPSSNMWCGGLQASKK